MFEAACYLAAATLFGGTVATLYWRTRFMNAKADAEAVATECERHKHVAGAWRELANDTARDLQELRKAIPLRDPHTHKFVKRVSQ